MRVLCTCVPGYGHFHAPGVLEAAVEGLGDEAMNVIVTVGPNRDPAELGPQPPNVHVERYIPQSLLLPRCDVVVAHGGSGTTLAALAQGGPLLVLPQGANQFGNAERCAELGGSHPPAPGPGGRNIDPPGRARPGRARVVPPAGRRTGRRDPRHARPWRSCP